MKAGLGVPLIGWAPLFSARGRVVTLGSATVVSDADLSVRKAQAYIQSITYHVYPFSIYDVNIPDVVYFVGGGIPVLRRFPRIGRLRCPYSAYIRTANFV